MLEIVESLVKQISLRQVAKQIGVRPETLCIALKNKTVSNKVAEFFGYEKQIVYVPKSEETL